MGRLTLAWLCLIVLAGGCSASNNQLIAAGISTGTAVALAAANRAITHDCWASCDHGYVCDRESGVCVLPSELKVPSRPIADPDDWDEGCIEEDDGTRLCPDDPPAHVPIGAPADAESDQTGSCSTPCPDGGSCRTGDGGIICAGAPAPD